MYRFLLLISLNLLAPSCSQLNQEPREQKPSGKLALKSTPTEQRPRVLVLTDIGNEPDDAQSLVRYLVYSNEFETEGILATTSTWLRDKVETGRIHGHIDAYEKVRDNLLAHHTGFPTAEELRSRVKSCKAIYGMDAVGEGHDSEGSEHIISVIDKEDERPVWLSIWGGSNCLAQALWKVRQNRSPEELASFVSKIRVYAIADQDLSGPWLRKEFPDLFYIVTPSDQDGDNYSQGTWVGISGDKFHGKFKGPNFDLVSNAFHLANIRRHGALGRRYPATKYLTEGDTPSFLGLIKNGLAWNESPSFGGWGGRYTISQPVGETRPIWTNASDQVTAHDGNEYTTNHATIWRWREGYQHDFAARMDWSVTANFDEANHNPHAVLNGDESLNPVTLAPNDEGLISFSAEGSSDPDGDLLHYRWFVYDEAGDFEGKYRTSYPSYSGAMGNQGTSFEIKINEIEKPGRLHLILELKDQGEPALYSYRRGIVEIGREN